MFIQTEATPNPETMKFLPGRAVMGQGSADFPTPELAERSPLAQSIFGVEGVTAVFLGSDFVTVTKDGEAGVEWNHIKPSVLGAIMDHFTSGAPVLLDGAEGGGAQEIPDEEYSETDAEIVAEVKELLESRVRPAVAADGGDIIFHAYKEGIVWLTMQGACAGCPASTMTLKQGIENLLRHYIPEIEEVRAVE
ncbi:MAG: NifU family protein [Alphaproteobacteria bacterium]